MYTKLSYIYNGDADSISHSNSLAYAFTDLAKMFKTLVQQIEILNLLLQ